MAVDPIGDNATTYMLKAMQALGYEPGAIIGTHWAAGGCKQHFFIVFPTDGQEPPFMMFMDDETEQIRVIQKDQIDLQLHRHINFTGGFINADFLYGGQDFFWIGLVPDQKVQANVYIHFAKDECGFVVDRVLYPAPLGKRRYNPQISGLYCKTYSKWRLIMSRPKLVIVGLGAGILLVFGLVLGIAQADSIQKDISVYFRGIQLVAGGRIVQTDKEPFIYDGTTYVPLRTMAETLGQNVTWVAATNQIIITDDAVQDVALLGSFPLASWYWGDGAVNQDVIVDGKKVTPALRFRNGKAAATITEVDIRWNLDGQYKTVEGIIGVPDQGARSEEDVSLLVDGKVVWTGHFAPGTRALKFKVDDLAVAKQLEMKVDPVTSLSNVFGLIGDFYVTGVLQR